MADIRQAGALLVLTGVGLAGWSLGNRDSNDEHKVTEKISVVHLASTDADVTVQVGDVETTTVKEKRSYWLVQRGDSYSVDGETLRLDGDCGWQCRSDFVVTVPRGTRVTGDNGSGDLTLTGVGGVDARATSGDIHLNSVAGDVKFDLTSGELSVDRVSGRLDLEATSGDIKATHLEKGPVHLKTTSGDVEVRLDQAADVTVRGTSGDIRVVAPEAAYRVKTDTSSGKVKNGLGDRTDGTYGIDARTVSGDVELASR